MGDRLGIYFGLPEDDYHADPALGSTDIKNLYHSPCDWQWSRLHPDEPKKTPHLDIGTGVHELVLLGKESFLSRVEKSPYPDFRKKEAREWRDATLAAGKVILTEDEFEQVISAAGAILNSPNLRSEFQNGVPEVSVFWEDDGVRMKARYDYMKIRGTVDLKTFSEKYTQSLKRTVTQTLADRRYDVQACHYIAGRKQMGNLLNMGLVYGEKDIAQFNLTAAKQRLEDAIGHEASADVIRELAKHRDTFQEKCETATNDNIPKVDWLEKACTNPDPTWVWVFFKVTGAPTAFAVNAMNARDMWDIAGRTRARAIENYRLFRDKFGDTDIWVEEIEPFVIHYEDLPAWYANE